MFVVECLVEPFDRETPAQRFGSQLAEYIFRVGCEPDASEFARIVEYQAAQTAIFTDQAEDQPIMFFRLNFTRFDLEIAAHAQVDEETEIR